MVTTLKALSVFAVVLLIVLTANPTHRTISNPTSSATERDSIRQAINSLAVQFMQTRNHVGLSMGVINHHTVYTFNYGTLDRSRQVRPTPHTLFEIASITKTFTGVLLAQALLEKKLNLDDDIHKYLKKPYPNLYYNGSPIRIRHLANHTSGLPKFLPELRKDVSPQMLMDQYKNYSEESFLSDLETVQLADAPGTQYVYSNAGPELLGIILQTIYQRSYGDLLSHYITTPQQMTDTKLIIKGSDQFRFAKGYDQHGQPMPRLLWWRNVPAAAGLKSTISDLVKYVQFNLDETNPVIRLAHHPGVAVPDQQAVHIGLFWFSQIREDGSCKVFHAGGSFGTTSYCAFYPGKHTGVVLLANDAGTTTERQLVEMSDKIFALLN